MVHPISFLLMCVVLIFPNPLLSSFARLPLSLLAMPKVDPRNEVGVIVHAISNRVPGDHATKNIYGNVNYAKMFLQGILVNVFDGRAPVMGHGILAVKYLAEYRDSLKIALC